MRSQWAVWSGSARYGQWVGTGATLNGKRAELLLHSWNGQEAGMSINTVGTQKAFSEKMEGGEKRKGRGSLPVYLRRKMLEVTHVGSFYSFLPVMRWAGPEQARVLFSCKEAEWARGISPAAAHLGLCQRVGQGCLGPGHEGRPPACWVSLGWPRQGPQPVLHACLAWQAPSP